MDEVAREASFWAKVQKAGPSECWLWVASRNPQGYGHFWNPERRLMDLAHRYSYRRFVEDIGPGVVGARGTVVRHTCDNPPCVNPAHLISGTQLDNMRDSVIRGRFGRGHAGQRNGRAKLTAAQVAEIRASVTGRHGERSALARQYGVSTAQISKILLGQTWAA